MLWLSDEVSLAHLVISPDNWMRLWVCRLHAATPLFTFESTFVVGGMRDFELPQE